MNSTGIILFLVLTGIFIYDFYFLKKSNVKILLCLSSSAILLAFNLILLFIGLLLGNVIFGSKNDYWVIISLILIISLTYFRFKGRTIKEVKKSESLKKIKTLSPKEKQISEIKGVAYVGFFIAIVNTIFLFVIKKDNSLDYYFLFLEPILMFILAYWTYKKLSFFGCLSITCLFILAKLIMVIPILLAGGKAGLPGLGLSMIFGYYFIKGTINAYKYNYQK